MTKLILICRTCNSSGTVRNVNFEACKYDPSTADTEGECDVCPYKEGCDKGEFVVCPNCKGEGVAVFNSERWMWMEREV